MQLATEETLRAMIGDRDRAISAKEKANKALRVEIAERDRTIVELRKRLHRAGGNVNIEPEDT